MTKREGTYSGSDLRAVVHTVNDGSIDPSDIASSACLPKMEMRKYSAYFGVVTACIVLTLTACGSGTTPITELRSPDGRYNVSLNGSASKPHVPFVYTRVTANVVAERPLCEVFELYMADFFDTAFFDRYARPAWISENTVAFKRQLDGVDERVDRVIVRNDSSASVPCLKITVLDLLLVLDVKPKAQLSLPVSRQPGGAVYFAAELPASAGRNPIVETSFDRSAYPDRELVSSVVIDNENRVTLSVDTRPAKAPAQRW